jgi:hypothetical protein
MKRRTIDHQSKYHFDKSQSAWGTKWHTNNDANNRTSIVTHQRSFHRRDRHQYTVLTIVLISFFQQEAEFAHLRVSADVSQTNQQDISANLFEKGFLKLSWPVFLCWLNELHTA